MPHCNPPPLPYRLWTSATGCIFFAGLRPARRPLNSSGAGGARRRVSCPLTYQPAPTRRLTLSPPVRQYRDHAADRRQVFRRRCRPRCSTKSELEFVGQDLAHEHVETLDEALAIIRAERRAARSAHRAEAAMSPALWRTTRPTASASSTTTSAAPSSAAGWS